MPKKKTITGKKHKGFYIYSRDLLSSQRYRRCSWATKGVYLDLLNVLAVQDHPGALCLRDFDLKPRGERSLTQRCLACQKKAKNGEYQSIKYFAEAIAVSASGPRPGLIHGLQELYMRGIICIVGDTLIQPRMYRDSGMEVTDFEGQPIDIGEGEYMTVVGSPDDAPADPDAERLRLSGLADSGMNKGVENDPKNDPKKSRVGAGDAPAPAIRVRVGVGDNNINSKDSIGGVGELAATGPTDWTRVSKQGEDDPTAFWPFWQQYDKKRIGTHWINIATVYQAWTALTDAERTAAMAFVPQYVAATRSKQYRLHPLNYLEQRAWLTVEIEGGRVRHQHVDEAEQSTAKKTPTATHPPQRPASRPVSDNPPSLDEICAYFDERRTQGKPMRHISAEQFYLMCETNGWTRGKDRKPIMNWKSFAIQCDNWRRDHGEQPIYDEQGNEIKYETTRRDNGHRQSGATGAQRGYDPDHPSNEQLVEQSVRIMQELRREGEQGAGDEVF